jgi:WhiB family transcriptional regulator, redox-sensing transcriptional regulator
MTVDTCWRDLAACRDLVTAYYDPFFAATEDGDRQAKAICAICSVSDPCLAFAIRTGQFWGIWGGKTPQELRPLIAQDRRGRPREQRTPAGHPNASKTLCKRGHPFDAANTYYAPDGQRRCRTCLREAQGGGSDAA